jgi:REP element-mobilizing transposase RayT
MNRGRNRQLIFPTDAFYSLFRNLMHEAGDRYGVQFHAYCLMPNHFHLFVSTPSGNISAFMHFLEGTYVQKHNFFNSEDGPLFRSRFTSKLVADDSYALYLSRYIHRNPIEGQSPLVQELDQYPYSSYREYVGRHDGWMDKRLVMGLLGDSSPDRYRAYAEQRADPHPYGDYLHKWSNRKLACDAIVESLAYAAGCSTDEVQQVRCGRGAQNPLRWIAVIGCTDWGLVPQRAVVQHFNIGNRNTIPRYRSVLSTARERDMRINHLANHLQEAIRNM